VKRRSDAANHPRRTYRWALAACLAGLLGTAACAQAPSACARPELQGQKRDPATIQQLEKAWSIAYLKGDAGLEACLLLPGFTEILGDGRVMHLDDELALARSNRGKHLPIPGFPAEHVLLHGDAAVAFGLGSSKAADGQVHRQWFADYYVWNHGAWHVYFAQQTPIQPR
jgi:hypothetical protein